MERLVYEFSKEESQSERDALAKDIRHKKREAETSSSSFAELADELDQISSSTLSKILNFRKISKLKEETGTAQIKSEEAKKEYESAKRVIADFYEKQEQKWKNLPFQKEDIERYFDPEYLKTLSLEDYKKVLERFGGGMVTHVTRQGIRDHADMGILGHHGGKGKLHNGFKQILESHTISHNMDLLISKENRAERIAKYFDFDACQNKEEAITKLELFTDEQRQHVAGSFVDFHGPHFAVEKVLDRFYGGETGNEIFFAFPSYMMAAHYFHRNDPHRPNPASNYNDLWTYFKKDDEVDINSGIVFIPENAQVDPQTGSIYELNEQGQAIEDVETVGKIVELVSRPEFQEFAMRAKEVLGKLQSGAYDEYIKNKELFIRSRGNGQSTAQAYEQLEKELRQIAPGITQHEIEILIDYSFLEDVTLNIHSPELVLKNVQNRLADKAQLFKKAKQTVSSKEYWDEYFAAHSASKPSKIVYYESGDPTWALKQWRNGLDKNHKTEIVDFPETRIFKQITEESPDLPDNILADLQAFKAEVMEIIDQHFPF